MGSIVYRNSVETYAGIHLQVYTIHLILIKYKPSRKVNAWDEEDKVDKLSQVVCVE